MLTRYRKILGLKPAAIMKTDYELDMVVMVRESIPEIAHLSAHNLVKLWEEFSDHYCASFLVCSEERVKEFWEWCSEDTYDNEEEND